MAIVGIGSNYSRAYEMYMAQKKETAPKAQPIETASEKAGDKKPVAEKAVSNYDSYLRKHYDCMSKGNVAISREYLKKCSGNSQEAKKLEDMGKNPIIVTSPIVRMYYKRLTQDYLKDLIVISYNEIESNVELQSVGMVSV